MNKEQLLKLRKEMKKPEFVVKESNFAPRIETRWRFPRGRHSKVRQMHCGRPAMPNPGYGAPREVRGLDHSGLEMVVVHNFAELQALDSKTQGAIVAAAVGNKKKLSLLEAAQQHKITILNVKDAGAAVQKLVSNFQQRKESRKIRFAEASKKEEQKRKKAEERAQKEKQEKQEQKKAESTEEATAQEKEEQQLMEKTITKRQ